MTLIANQSTQTVDYSKTDNLTGFLNHVLNTSTSNSAYQTFVNVANLGQIKLNDATGEITIPANTLNVVNAYNDKSQALRNAAPQPYGTQIKFNIGNYFSRFTDTEKGRLPFADETVINKNFSTDSV